MRYQAHSLSSGRLLNTRILDAPVDAVYVTPSLFRTFICTAGCTACCQKFTLDYVPSEFLNVNDTRGFEKREVWVNGKSKWIWTNDQNQNPICDFLTVEKPAGGLGCAQWPSSPLSCISAPQLQFIQMRPRRTYVLSKPFGRAWAMTPTPQCEFRPWRDEKELIDQLYMRIQILDRFAEWARYFGIKTCIRAVQKELKRPLKTGLVPTAAIEVWRAE